MVRSSFAAGCSITARMSADRRGDQAQDQAAWPYAAARLRLNSPRPAVDTRALQAYLGHRNIQHTVRYRELAPDRLKKLVRKSRDKTPAPRAISKMLHTRKPSRLSIRAGIGSLARPSLESMDATFVWGAPDDVHILHRFNPGAGSWVTPRRFARQTLNVICATHCGLRY